MLAVELNVSWRRAKNIVVWLVTPANAKTPTTLADIETIASDRHAGDRPCVRFGVNTAGRIWVASAFVAMHGDESRGRIVAPALGDEEFLDSHPLIWGAITFEATHLRVSADTTFVDSSRRHLAFEREKRARALLEGLPTWQGLVTQAAEVQYRRF